jgi:hypothetical protein
MPGAARIASGSDRDAFIALSAELTGFDEVELRGTGVADRHLEWLAAGFPDVVPELLDAWRRVAGEPAERREQAVRDAILADPKLGPFARAVTLLWYTANWNQIDESWSEAYGGHAADQNQAFGYAYPEGLMWKAAETHPMGAKPTGFGTWAFAPPEP